MKADIQHSFPGIYCIINKINNKKYIGKAKNIYKRIKTHITNLNRKSKDENRHLINSWHKHGRINFYYIILEQIILDEKLLSEKELYYQDLYKVHSRKFGYNLRKDSSTKMIVSEETRDKLRKSSIDKFVKFPELKEKVSKKLKNLWKDNESLREDMSIKISKLKTKYRILKLDYDLNIMDTYESCKYIKDNTKYYLPAILSCCNGGKNSYLGFLWRYQDISTGVIINQKHPEDRKLECRIKQGKKIFIKNKETGDVSEFPTLKIFSEKIGISYPICFNLIKNKVKNTNKYPFIISYDENFGT